MKKRITIKVLMRLLAEHGITATIERTDSLDADPEYEYSIYRDDDRMGLDEWGDIIEGWGYMFDAVDRRMPDLACWWDDDAVEDNRHYGRFNALVGERIYNFN